MTINDYRRNSTAQGWALYTAKDREMAQWLEDERAQSELLGTFLGSHGEDKS